MKPWTCAPDNVAPEEDEIPEFGVFNFMEMSVEEATRAILRDVAHEGFRGVQAGYSDYEALGNSGRRGL
jgi:hypothetical protein